MMIVEEPKYSSWYELVKETDTSLKLKLSLDHPHLALSFLGVITNWSGDLLSLNSISHHATLACLVKLDPKLPEVDCFKIAFQVISAVAELNLRGVSFPTIGLDDVLLDAYHYVRVTGLEWAEFESLEFPDDSWALSKILSSLVPETKKEKSHPLMTTIVDLSHTLSPAELFYHISGNRI